MADAFANSRGGSGDSVLWINTSFPSAQLITSDFFFDGKNGIQAMVVLLVTTAERLMGKTHKPGITEGAVLNFGLSTGILGWDSTASFCLRTNCTNINVSSVIIYIYM